MLAAASNEELGRWMKATKRVISMSGGDVQTRSEMKRTVEARVSPQVANLIALSKLDREELLEVPLRKLYEVAAYLQLELTGELAQKATQEAQGQVRAPGSAHAHCGSDQGRRPRAGGARGGGGRRPRASAKTRPGRPRIRAWGGSGGGGGKGRARAPSVLRGEAAQGGGSGGGGRDYASLY